MKKTFTKFTLLMAAMLTCVGSYAIQYTAVQSGNFNSASVWTPSVPPSNVGANDVIINSGVTVTLNQNLSLTFPNSILQLKGTAKIVSTSNNYISLTGGNFLGDAQSEIEIDSIYMSTLTSLSYLGKFKVNNFTVSGANITSTMDITIKENLYLRGAVTTLAMGTLGFDASATPAPRIIFAGGNLLVTGGMLSTANNYSVRYEDASTSISSTNWELTAPSLQMIDIAIGSSNTTILQSDLNLTASLKQTSGTLMLNGNNLTFSGNSSIDASGSGTIAVTNASDITINSGAASLGSIRFDGTNNTVNDFTLNAGVNSATLNVESDLLINGQLDLQSGRLNIGVNDLSIAGGTLNGGSSSSYVVTNDGGKMIMSIGTDASATYPVGNTKGYAPVKITCKNGSSFTNLGVGVDEEVKAMGNTGADWTASKPLVAATWTVTQSTSTTVDHDMELSWESAMEVNAFDNTKYFVSTYNTSWENSTSFSAATTSGNMHTGMKSDLNKGGTYGVFDNRTLGIDEVVNNNTVNVYPNPTNGILYFNLNGNQALQGSIHDITGRTIRVFELNTATDNSINVSRLKPGMYYLQLNGENVHANTKFIKQ